MDPIKANKLDQQHIQDDETKLKTENNEKLERPKISFKVVRKLIRHEVEDTYVHDPSSVDKKQEPDESTTTEINDGEILSTKLIEEENPSNENKRETLVSRDFDDKSQEDENNTDKLEPRENRKPINVVVKHKLQGSKKRRYTFWMNHGKARSEALELCQLPFEAIPDYQSVKAEGKRLKKERRMLKKQMKREISHSLIQAGSEEPLEL